MDTNDQPVPHATQLYERLLSELARFKAEQATAVHAVETSTVAHLAREYTAAYNDSRRSGLADDIAEGISLADAGTIRRAAKAVELGMPGIICRAHATGMEPNEIARQLGATGSYVRRILRKNPTLLAEAVQTRAAEKQPAPCCVPSAVPRIPHPELNGLTLPQGHTLDCPARATT